LGLVPRIEATAHNDQPPGAEDDRAGPKARVA